MSVSPRGRTYYTKEEYKQLIADIELYKKEKAESLMKRPAGLLLDSSLISTTNERKYTHKIIQCGEYYQVYNYYDHRVKKEKDMEKFYESKIYYVDTEDLSKTKYKNELRTIEIKNILRSKIQLQRLVKSNEKIFKTFITLTFAENIQDITLANKKFKNWRDTLSKYLKKQKKEFSYVCVPEFQKRGAVHYHLLTNLDIKENSDVIIAQKGKKNQYDVKYWKHGFSSVFPMKDVNVVGYITKYMTKDIDNRLWGKRRYLYSLNLRQPSVIYIDSEVEKENSHLLMIELLLKQTYKNMYCDKLGQVIEFREFKEE